MVGRTSQCASDPLALRRAGELTLEDLRAHALEHGEPAITSAKQELYEQLINQYI